MSFAATRYEHIVLNKNNDPIIAGSKMKVIDLMLDKIAYGWSPEELQYQHPQLKLGQIYSALAYYSDNQEEMDQKIEGQLRQIDKLIISVKHPPLVTKLKAKNLI